MLLIQDIMVSDALIEEEFVCHLDRCRGACCWKGDYGAPLEPAEVTLLDTLLPEIRSWLDEASNELLDRDGAVTYYQERKFYGTTLKPNGACVFMTRDEYGIAQCGIEKAFEGGSIDFRKPISCHLYPVRIAREPALNFEALNYDAWSICSDACTLGKSLKMPLYRFVREALVRRYGADFYDELDAVAKDLTAQGDDQSHS